MQPGKLSELVQLAGETSSERRRELLREVTDLFFAPVTAHSPAEQALFDEVLQQLTGEMEEAVRAELGIRFADAPDAPQGLVRALASDTFAVAEPVLRRSPLLDEADLLHVVRTQGQEHLRAVSGREHVPEAVSGVIVERGDDHTLGVLLRNDGARLSRAASEAAIERAQANPDLHEAVVNRKSLPPDLLNEMYFVVEARLRERILQENAMLDPARLDAALSQGRRQVAARHGALPADYEAIEAEVSALRAAGQLTPPMLARFVRAPDGQTRFLVALCQLTDLDYFTARHVIEQRQIDALAVICKAADMDRPLFLTYALAVLGKSDDAMGKAQEYARLYADLPQDTARRTLRFWRLRRQSATSTTPAAA